MSFHLFHFYFQFHHFLASCTAPFLSSFFSSLIVFHHLSIALSFCFSFKLIAFISVSFSFISTFFAPVPSLPPRLAVFIFQSFISTNVRQCFCPPSIDPQGPKEMRGERLGERGRRLVTRNEAGRCIAGGVADMSEKRWKAGQEREKKRIRSDKGWRKPSVF